MDKSVFKVVVLGCLGGPRENNLSGYLVTRADQEAYIALDAGTLLHGIEKAAAKGAFNLDSDTPFSISGEVLKKRVKSYLISHPHLDHLFALVINSQVDQRKPILANDFTIDAIRDHVFNGVVWPNYGNEGKDPIDFYHYTRLKLGKKETIAETNLTVEAFALTHFKGYLSTAFLIESNGAYLLYFGDTSSDSHYEEKRMREVWQRVAPLVKQKKLRAIFLECSYPSNETSKGACTHLTSSEMLEELRTLHALASAPLAGLKVIVTHCKESLEKTVDKRKTIQEELIAANDLGLEFIFPSQGESYLL